MSHHNDVVTATLESVVLSEDDRRSSTQRIRALIESVGPTTHQDLIVRMHPETYQRAWATSIATACGRVAEEVLSRLEYRCNRQHAQDTVSLSTTQLTSDERCFA